MSDGWPRTRLDRVATVNARIGWKALTASEYQDQGFAFLATPNIKSERIDFGNVNFISEYRYNESPELKLRVGDVLLAKDGSTLGIANVVRELPVEATVNGSVAVIRPFGIDARYLMYVLRGDETQEWITQVKDGMGVPHLFQADIKKFWLPFPPAPEQRRIADFLDDQVTRIDNIVAARRRQADLAEASRATRLGMLYDGPRARPLRTLLAQSPCYGVLVPRFVDGDGVPLVRVNDLDSLAKAERQLAQIDRAQSVEYRRTVVDAGDVLVSVVGSLDKAAVVPPERRGANVARAVARLRPAPHVPSEVIFGWLKTTDYLDQARLETGGDTAQPTLNMGDLARFRVSLPDMDLSDLAREVVRIIEHHGGGARLFRESLSSLEGLKQSLITAAVTGEFDVSSADGSRVPA